MRGLMAKDIRLLKNQKNFLLVILVICIMFLVTSKSYGGVVAYVTFVCSMFGISTISYDEFENGMSFMFALPITRKLYVKEKYLFSTIMVFIGWFVTSVLTTIFMIVRHMQTPMNEWLAELPVYLVLGFVCIMIMLPLQLKFGVEKRQIAFVGLFMVVAIVLLLLTYLSDVMHIDLGGLQEKLEAMPTAGMIGFLVVLCMIAGAISYHISVKILEKREY